MTRSLAIAVAILVGLAGLPAAYAQDADPDTATDAAGVTGPRRCPPGLEPKLHGQLPGATTIRCHYKPIDPSDTKTVNGVVVAGDPVLSTVDVAFDDGRTAEVLIKADGTIDKITYSHDDLIDSSGWLMALVFWLFAAASVGGAVFVVTRKNLIAAVMGMVGSFLGIAAIFMMLYAQFLAVVQMLVYAGAIMVLFVFVVMILNRPEDEPVAPTGRLGQVLGGVAILYLVARLVMILVNVEPPNLATAMAAPPATPEHYDWGSVRAVGADLFGPGLFPFEAISILLLLAVVGAIAIARPLHSDDDAPAKARLDGVP